MVHDSWEAAHLTEEKVIGSYLELACLEGLESERVAHPDSPRLIGSAGSRSKTSPILCLSVSRIDGSLLWKRRS